MVHLAKILIVGYPGVGKTHLLHLLFGEQMPEVRRSTPVMARPVQSIQAVFKDGSKFQKVTDAELYQLLGHAVNDNLKAKLHSPSTDQCSIQNASETVDEIYSPPSKRRKIQMLDDSLVSEVAENLVVPISNTLDAEPLQEMSWVYFIDSGGQPQFHQLLPAFLHNTDLNIFVLRLCDKLSDCPTIEYYNQEGKCVSSTVSSLSTKKILQCCAQTTQTIDKKGESRLFVVGTHRDLPNHCNENLQQKNERLIQLFGSSMKKYIVKCNDKKGEVLYPLNTKYPVEADHEIIAKLRKDILFIAKKSKPTNIPIRWLIFHQEVQALSNKNKVDIVSFEQCNIIAERLHMHTGDTRDALLFFSDLNVILYYPDILPEMVFANSQTLLNIVTHIISYVVYGQECTPRDDPVVTRAHSEGIISVQIFEWMRVDLKQHYIPPMLNSEELMKLLQHVHVVCKHNEDYFMPSLLEGVDSDGIEKILSQNHDSVAPCAIHYTDRWVECGKFAFLVTSLLSFSEGRWNLASDTSGQLLCVHSNIIKLRYNSTTVTLVDCMSHIEIHVCDGDMQECKDNCNEIISFVLDAFEVKLQIAFVCPCKHYERHVATIISSKQIRKEVKVLCSKDQSKSFSISNVGTEPLVWIKDLPGKSPKLENTLFLVHCN